MAMLKGGPYDGFQYDVYYDQPHRELVAYTDRFTDKPVVEPAETHVIEGHRVAGYKLRDDEYVFVPGLWDRKDDGLRELWWRKEEV